MGVGLQDAYEAYVPIYWIFQYRQTNFAVFVQDAGEYFGTQKLHVFENDIHPVPAEDS